MLFFFAGLHAQNAVGARMRELGAQKTNFTQVQVLQATGKSPSADVAKVVDNATIAQIVPAGISAIVSQAPEFVQIDVPFKGLLVPVQLYKVDITAEGFHIDTDKRANIAYSPGVHYRGTVSGDFTSVAALNFFEGELNGVVSSLEHGNIVIGKIDIPGTEDYVIYSDAEMKVLNQFQCAVKDDAGHEHGESESESAKSVLTTRCVTTYFEIDYDLFQQNGSNTATTANWMTSVFNNVQTLFANDQITVSLKSIYIWTEDDPYTGDSSADYLYQFNDVRPVFDGDVGQLVGIDPGGLGGVAVTINGLCSQNNFSYSDVNFSYSTVPTFSWTIQVITHELGHLVGSRHTHACVWNGNNTAIDNCGPSAGVSEGSGCVTSPPTIPSPMQKGTIMSYCHLVSGVGISFANGFGPQPKAAIISAVNNGTCLSFDCVNTCINTVADITVTNVTNTTATISWNELGTQTSWQVAIMPFNSNFPTWINVSSPTYTATGLNPNTYYKIRIRPVCTGLSSTYRQQIFATSADWCNGVTITDTGGANSDYTDLQEYTRVFIPNLPNRKIKLTFTEFDLETDYDYLYVYDGANTNATDLSAGGFTGTNIPGPFVSSSPDGALTLRFFSDPGVVEAGYVATVSCEESLAVAGFENVDLTYWPNPTNGTLNLLANNQIDEIAVYNPQGRLLYRGTPNAIEAKVDISGFATGTYFFRVRLGEAEANFKIMKY